MEDIPVLVEEDMEASERFRDSLHEEIKIKKPSRKMVFLAVFFLFPSAFSLEGTRQKIPAGVSVKEVIEKVFRDKRLRRGNQEGPGKFEKLFSGLSAAYLALSAAPTLAFFTALFIVLSSPTALQEGRPVSRKV